MIRAVVPFAAVPRVSGGKSLRRGGDGLKVRTSQCPPSRPSQGQGREEVSTYSRYLVGIGGKGEAEGQKGPSHTGGGGTGCQSTPAV